jgi:hypothetical protein
MARRTKKEQTKTKRTRRSPEQMIRDLEAKIRGIKERAERRKARRDPALRHVTAAVRSIDKAMRATTDVATRKALEQTRATLAACLAMSGVTPKGRAARSVAGAHVDPAAVLAYLRNNPGSGGEQVADAMGTDTKTLRPVMKQLIADGAVAARGKGRGMRYAQA